MSQRRGILVNHFVNADGRWPLTKSPNQQADVITAEIRIHWPHPAPKEEVVKALGAVLGKALDEIREKMPDD
jgi:hypothetical protein